MSAVARKPAALACRSPVAHVRSGSGKDCCDCACGMRCWKNVPDSALHREWAAREERGPHLYCWKHSTSYQPATNA
eukprot:589877-Rhodomonas_salina.1